jgi:hypothetical protein
MHLIRTFTRSTMFKHPLSSMNPASPAIARTIRLYRAFISAFSPKIFLPKTVSTKTISPNTVAPKTDSPKQNSSKDSLAERQFFRKTILSKDDFAANRIQQSVINKKYKKMVAFTYLSSKLLFNEFSLRRICFRRICLRRICFRRNFLRRDCFRRNCFRRIFLAPAHKHQQKIAVSVLRHMLKF